MRRPSKSAIYCKTRRVCSAQDHDFSSFGVSTIRNKKRSFQVVAPSVRRLSALSGTEPESLIPYFHISRGVPQRGNRTPRGYNNSLLFRRQVVSERWVNVCLAEPSGCAGWDKSEIKSYAYGPTKDKRRNEKDCGLETPAYPGFARVLMMFDSHRDLGCLTCTRTTFCLDLSSSVCKCNIVTISDLESRKVEKCSVEVSRH